MTTALEKLRSEFNSPSNQDIPLESIKDVFNELLDRVASETMNGGSQPQTATATVTTDPNTFTVEHVFDLGHATTAYWKATITAQAPDGETFGMGAGQIHGDEGGHQVSRDGATYIIYNVNSFPYVQDDPTGTIGDVIEALVICPRYLKLQLFVYDENFDIYAGANHPTVTFRLDVEYL